MGKYPEGEHQLFSISPQRKFNQENGLFASLVVLVNKVLNDLLLDIKKVHKHLASLQLF